MVSSVAGWWVGWRGASRIGFLHKGSEKGAKRAQKPADFLFVVLPDSEEIILIPVQKENLHWYKYSWKLTVQSSVLAGPSRKTPPQTIPPFRSIVRKSTTVYNLVQSIFPDSREWLQRSVTSTHDTGKRREAKRRTTILLLEPIVGFHKMAVAQKSTMSG